GLESYGRGVNRLLELPGLEEAAVGVAASNQAAARLFVAGKSVLFAADQPLMEEVFGPSTVVVELDDASELVEAARAVSGQLTATVIGESEELGTNRTLVDELARRAGRVLFNGFPTGVAV